MKRNCFICITFLVIVLGCIGCWDRREIDELAIVKAIGFDTHKDGVEVTVQVLNPREVVKNTTGYDTPITTYTDSGQTVMETLRKLTNQLPRKAYLSHLRVIVISEDLARKGIRNILDLLMRDHEMRTDFDFIISKDVQAKDIVSILTSLNEVPGNKLFDSLEEAEQSWGSTTVVRIHDIVNALIGEGRHPVVTALDLYGSPQEGDTEKNIETSN